MENTIDSTIDAIEQLSNQEGLDLWFEKPDWLENTINMVVMKEIDDPYQIDVLQQHSCMFIEDVICPLVYTNADSTVESLTVLVEIRDEDDEMIDFSKIEDGSAFQDHEIMHVYFQIPLPKDERSLYAIQTYVSLMRSQDEFLQM